MRGNMNPEQMKKAMQRLGIEQEDIQASKVTIETPQKTLVFNNPSVQKVDMMGQETYQVMGEPHKQGKAQTEETSVDIEDDDIQTVVNKTGCTEDEAKEAIEQHDYDLAAAIMSLQ